MDESGHGLASFNVYMCTVIRALCSQTVYRYLFRLLSKYQNNSTSTSALDSKIKRVCLLFHVALKYFYDY